MTPEQEAMFALEEGSQPAQGAGELTESQAVGMGMGQAAQYMASNGPTYATHLAPAKTMTMQEFKEQEMREKMGLPSNASEAERVQTLESKVEKIETGISQILSHLTNPGGTTPTPPTCAIPSSAPSLTPMPVLTQAEEEAIQRAETPLPTSPQESPQQPKTVTLKSGKKVLIPTIQRQALNLGSTPEEIVTTPDRVEFTVPKEHPLSGKGPEDLEPEEDGLWTEDQIVAQVEVPEEEPVEDPRLVQLQKLVDDVIGFLKAHDPHKVWRKHLSTHLHRQVGYSGWSKKLQAEFDKRFQSFLSDPQMITTTCRKVLEMELGAAVGVQWVATMLVMAAGWAAFAMCGLDN